MPTKVLLENTTTKHYYETMLPSERQLHRLQTQETIDALKESEDNLEEARELEFFAVFKMRSHAEKFVNELANDYDFIKFFENEGDDDDMFHGVVISKMIPIDVKELDFIAVYLMKHSEEYYGRYEGWGTQLSQ